MTEYTAGEIYEFPRGYENHPAGQRVEVVPTLSYSPGVRVVPVGGDWTETETIPFCYADNVLRKVEPGNKFKEGWFLGVTKNIGLLKMSEAYEVLPSDEEHILRVRRLGDDFEVYRVHIPLAEEIFYPIVGPKPPTPEKVNYYLFPNGIQVKEISRYLTSNSAQAVQYLSRCSRIDGIRKGSQEDRLSDLKKAVDFIQDEITRVEKLKDGGV